jgi:oligopeptide/dipeptide ABC transporter ATP-binding protein
VFFIERIDKSRGKKNIFFFKKLIRLFFSYSKALMSALPIPGPDLRREKILLHGAVPSPLNPPSGCSFHPRCFVRREICSMEAPVLKDVGGGHRSACHLIQ